MRTDELRWNAMGLTAEEILEHVRALPLRERLQLVERVKSEVENANAEPKFAKMTEKPAIMDDLTDEEFEDFLETIRRNRREQPLRTPR